jgi:hypothetical protein
LNGTTYNTSGTYSSTVGSSNNYSMSFDGNNDYIDAGLDVNLAFGNNDHSYSAWVYINNWNTAQYTYIISTGNNALGEASGFGLTGVHGSFNGGNLLCSAYGSPIVTTQNAISTHQWYYVSMVYRSNLQEIDFYLDGVLIQTISAQLNTTNGQIVLGGSVDLGNGVFHNGFLDDIEVWNTALTQQEIQNYMTCPPIGNESGLVGCWNFEEGSGNTVLDISGNGNDGAINGATYDSNVPAQSCGLTNANGCDSTATLNLTIAVCGCTDSVANNYNPLAILDDSSCCYINITATSTNIDCYGYDNGEALVVAQGGTEPYTFSWDTGMIVGVKVVTVSPTIIPVSQLNV